MGSRDDLPSSHSRAALRREAAVILRADNFTNSQCVPSEEDGVLTRAIVLWAATIEQRIHDPLTIRRDQPFTFRNGGLL